MTLLTDQVAVRLAGPPLDLEGSRDPQVRLTALFDAGTTTLLHDGEGQA